jgi:hypothetical protein
VLIAARFKYIATTSNSKLLEQQSAGRCAPSTLFHWTCDHSEALTILERQETTAAMETEAETTKRLVYSYGVERKGTKLKAWSRNRYSSEACSQDT